jgi:hypothetical protein
MPCGAGRRLRPKGRRKTRPFSSAWSLGRPIALRKTPCGASSRSGSRPAG